MFLFHLIPWWVPVLAIVAIAVLAYFGLLGPMVMALRKFGAWFRALPPNVRLAIAGTVAILVLIFIAWRWLDYHDEQLTTTVTKEVTAHWQAREDESNARYERNLTELQRKLERANSNADAAAAKHQQELIEKEAAHQARFRDLQQRRATNVTQEAIAACDLRRGVIVQYNAGAACANGDTAGCAATAPTTGAESANAASGVALDTFTDSINATQAALGVARGQVVGWQTYHANVLQPWIASTIEALSTCIPRGASPS